jgi:cytochrome c-type biogenesis protein CcmH/NrfG
VAGKLAVAPASVVAGFATSRADFFGNFDTKLFRSVDTAHTLEVKPLPETDKPPSFTGAVGSQFSIAVATSRSVVQLGEPVELAITIKSDQRLDTLSLGKLDYDGGLPKDKFTVPADPPTGELADDGKTKTFKVTATVTGATTEIPAIAFAYFDPVKSTYQTIHSDPIALSVKGGGSVVGTSDVIGVTPTKKSTAAQPLDGDLALVGADLALSSPGAVGDRPFGGTLLWLLVALLYAIPLGVFALRTWQLRTQTQRDEAAEVRGARKKVEAELARAEREPARETAGPLASSVRALARVLERELDDDGLLARLETESFSPSASSAPLSADLRKRVAELVKRWTAEARRRAPSSKAASNVAIVLVVLLGATRADAASELADARTTYADAMTMTQPSARKAAFARAEAALTAATGADPDRPELLADLGNAALGAGDVGTATLAYRRALAIDGSNARARKNLGWLRSRMPESLRPSSASAADTLFFFNDWPRGRRLVAGALAFAIVMLLLVPWGPRARRWRRGLRVIALLPAAVWIVMTASVVLEDRHPDDAVVMDAVVLRAADSAGAPAALTQPLPGGTEVTVLERRDTWTRVRVASGTVGWVQSGTVQAIAR